MPRGGQRKGAGRKSIANEVQTRDLARTAIIAKYGSLEEGLQSLLESDETALLKFVFEHAIGKPQDVVDITSMGDKITNAPQEVIIRDYSKKK